MTPENPYNVPQCHGSKDEIEWFWSRDVPNRPAVLVPRLVTWIQIFPGVFSLAEIGEVVADD